MSPPEGYTEISANNNIFLFKKENDYLIKSKIHLDKSTNIIEIVKNDELFELIKKLNTNIINEYKLKDNICKLGFSTKIMQEFDDNYAIKIKYKNIIHSDNNCEIKGRSIPYSNSKYTNIFNLEKVKIKISTENNDLKITILYVTNDNTFSDIEKIMLSKLLLNIVDSLNCYCK